jgi:hypothetical protein
MGVGSGGGEQEKHKQAQHHPGKERNLLTPATE